MALIDRQPDLSFEQHRRLLEALQPFYVTEVAFVIEIKS